MNRHAREYKRNKPIEYYVGKIFSLGHFQVAHALITSFRRSVRSVRSLFFRFLSRQSSEKNKLIKPVMPWPYVMTYFQISLTEKLFTVYAPFGAIACTFTLFPDNLSRNSCRYISLQDTDIYTCAVQTTCSRHNIENPKTVRSTVTDDSKSSHGSH